MDRILGLSSFRATGDAAKFGSGRRLICLGVPLKRAKCGAMSAIGPKRTFRLSRRMSAFGCKADITM
jgi:hypothetical protein